MIDLSNAFHPQRSAGSIILSLTSLNFAMLFLACSMVFAETSPKPLPTSTAEMTREDWQAVVRSGEESVATGQVSASTLHNLALARFNLGETAQAVGAWLAAWQRDPKDQEISAGLEAALTSQGLTIQSLDLSAHGPLVAFIAKQPAVVLTGLSAGATLLLMFTLACGLLMMFGLVRKSTHLRPMRWTFWVSGFLTLVLWVMVLVWDSQSGTWAVVIDPAGARVYEAVPTGGAELGRIKEGTPIYVRSDTYAPRLHILDANGYNGYVDALSIRLIR